MSFLGGLLRGATNILKVVPGPVGALASVANRALGGGAGAAPPTQLIPQSVAPMQMNPFSGSVQGPTFRGPSFQVGSGGVSFQGPSYQGPSGAVTVGGPGAAAMYKGYHENKVLVAARVMTANRGGLTPGMQRRVSQVVNQIVRNRHMNVLNARAANKAIRRIKGVVKTLRRIERHLPKVRSKSPGRFGRKR